MYTKIRNINKNNSISSENNNLTVNDIKNIKPTAISHYAEAAKGDRGEIGEEKSLNKNIRNKKIGSYYTDVVSDEEKILKNEDIFSRGITLKRINLDLSFPEYILNNKNNFSKFITFRAF